MGHVGMAVAQGRFMAAVLLLVSSGLHCFSSPAACPESCTCQRATVLNCSSSGLSLVPQQIGDSITELDLSHNSLSSITLHWPHRKLRNVCLGNNTITRLSLCIERSPRSQFVRDAQLRRLRPWSRRGCVSWAPTLHLLSVERNQLEQLPEGLEGSESLQVLQLSFNRISTLRPADFIHLRQLKELHLQHNLIASLHSQIFQDLARLKVLDLSFNMLTSIQPFMYLSLHTIGTDVRLDGNRWQCECGMRNLRRRMAYDRSRGLQTWTIVCASPAILSGTDLLQLEEDDLNCFSAENKPGLHQDVTINGGADILLSCSREDTLWWTPTSQSMSQPQAELLVSDITERDTGLYVCVSEEYEVVSVFNLQISKIGGTSRHTRSLSRNSQQIISQDTANRAGQARSDLTLAVCLSVLITFLVAFILGVFARPYIDVVWKRVFKKKKSTEANSVPSMDQRQYDNEAFSSGEEPGDVTTYRERRVTFSHVDFREDTSVMYYDTVACEREISINNNAVVECEVAEEVMHKAGDYKCENTSRQTITEDNQKNGRDPSDVTNAGHTHKTEFVHIPDPAELEERRRRSLSSSSDSSLSDKVLKDDKMTKGGGTKPSSSQLIEDSVQQSSHISAMPQISVESRTEIPGFSSEPFAEWTPHSNNTHPSDPDVWQENEEQFEFSDSVRSTSSSVVGSLNDVAAIPDKQNRDEMSSSSSYVSDDEPTHYTVNSDHEEEKGDTRDKGALDIRAPSLSSDSSSSSDSEGETTYDRVRPGKVGIAELPCHESVSHLSKTQFPAIDLEHIPHIKRRLDIKAPSLEFISSSSSHSKDEATFHTGRPGKVVDAKLPLQQSESQDQHARWPTIDLDNVPCIKRRVNIKARSDSSSGCDSEDETTHHRESPVKGNIVELPLQKCQPSDNPEAQWPAVDLGNITRIKRRLDIKGPSPPPDLLFSGGSRLDAMEGKREEASYSSSSSDDQEEDKVLSFSSDSSTSGDSEDEITGHPERQGPEDVNIVYKESQMVGHDPDSKWPALDLQHIPYIKRRLDIKVLSPAPDSSAKLEIMEMNKMPQIKQHEQGAVHITKPKESEAEVHDLKTQWPALDLEKTTRIKRRLDIKAPSQDIVSSSSSDSDDDVLKHVKKQEKGELNVARLPVTTTQRHDTETQWPALDLEKTTRIKRRLDIKRSSADSDSSAHSDSEDETTQHVKKQEHGEMHVARPPVATYDQESKWPVLDLDHTTRIKRRLDITSQDIVSSSSSDSDDDVIKHVKKQEKVELNVARHDTETQWPALDLEGTLRIKRRLDIQASLPAPSSSYSNDNDDKIADHTEKQRPAKLHSADMPLNDPDDRWPALDLEHLPHIKRRLHIKSPCPDLSSNTDIVEDKLPQTKKHEEREAYVTKLSFQESKAERNDQETEWPAIDLEHSMHIKRRLDIKAPSRDPDSSSSSDSEDETLNYTENQRPGVGGLPLQESQIVGHDPVTEWPALNVERSLHIKRRLDIKAPSLASDSSSSSDSEDETTHYASINVNAVGLPLQKSQNNIEPEAQWPAVDFVNITRIKRRLDIKGPSPPPDLLISGDNMKHTKEEKREEANKMSPYYSSSSSDEQEDAVENLNSPPTKAVPDPRLPELSIRSTNTPMFNISHSPKAEHNIKLEKYTIITDDMGEKPTSANSNTTPEINPELQSRWASMNLGISRFRKRLEITSHRSPSPASSETHGKVKTGTSQLPVAIDKGPSQNSMYKGETEAGERMARVELSSEAAKVAAESKSTWPHLDFTSIPTVKRALDIKAPIRTESSSSSSSEDETVYQSVPDLSHGVPRLKRRLDIKAPSPEHSRSPSSCSETESDVTAKGGAYATTMSGVTDYDSVITYKRLIMKDSSLPSDYFSLSDESQTTHHAEMVAQDGSSQAEKKTSLRARKLLSISFDDIVKKKTDQSRRTADVDLPPELRWTGIGRHLSDLPSSKRSLDVDSSYPQPSPPAQLERAPADSLSFSSIKSYNIKPDRGAEQITPLHSYSALSANNVFLAPSRSLDHSDSSAGNTNTTLSVLSEEKRERKGLSALRAMSSLRRKWDTDDENVSSGSSLYHDPQGDTSFNNHRPEVEIKPLAKPPLTHLTSTSLFERRATDVLYGIPSYRTHNAGDTEPPQEVPPPVPQTPPPDEAVELTWSP